MNPTISQILHKALYEIRETHNVAISELKIGWHQALDGSAVFITDIRINCVTLDTDGEEEAK